MKNNAIVSHVDALEILFSNRNRAYGAYQLRRQYSSTLARAFGFGLLLIALMVAMPHILKAFSGLMPVKVEDEKEYKTTTVVLTPPPPKPPTLNTPPPAARSAQRFVPLIVDKDEKIKEEPPKLSMEDLAKDPADVGKTTIDVPIQAPPTLNEPGLGIIESPKPSANDEPVEGFNVDRMPSFPGGEKELMEYLAKNIVYPNVAREANIQGTVVLTFVVGKDGSITDVGILKDIGGGCTKEAMRVVKSMPRWSPGEMKGNNVRVRFTLPVKFRLN